MVKTQLFNRYFYQQPNRISYRRRYMASAILDVIASHDLQSKIWSIQALLVVFVINPDIFDSAGKFSNLIV